MKIIIGLCGKKGSGKSTVAKYLVDQYQFKEYAFANILKDACMNIFGLRYEQLYGTLQQKETIDEYWNVTPRIILQDVGTAIRNIANKNPKLEKIWIKSLHRKIIQESKTRIVVSDIRYQDEADSLKEYIKDGWTVIIIHINRINDSVHLDNHESETQAIKYDYNIDNDKDIKCLINKLNAVLNITRDL